MKPFQSAFQWGRLLLVIVLVWAPALTPISFARAETPAPQLAAVQPNRAANDVDTPIEIRGEHFSNEEGLPQVFLGSTPLPQTAWESENALSALVPWGIHTGVYDLRVINPDGSEDTLASAFTVTEGVGQWNANAMDGGPVQVVIPVPSVSGLLYAYSNVTSAIYRSTDSAAHWETVGHANGQFFKDDPYDPQRLYLNNLQSTDGGATWNDLLANEPWPGAEQGPGWYTQTFPDPNHAGTLFLAAANIPASSSDPSGLLRSQDNGQTWEAVETGLLSGDTHVTALVFSGSAIYLGTRDGNLYQSNNSGTSWQRIGSSNVLESIGILKVNPYNSNELWITTHFSISANARVAKMDLSSPLHTVTQLTWPETDYPMNLGFLDTNTAYIGTRWDSGWILYNSGQDLMSFQPSTGDYVGNAVSSNGGQTWKDAQLPIFPEQIVFVPGSDTVYFGGDGLFYSINGGNSWQRAEGAPGTTRINALAVSRSGERTMIFIGAPGSDAPFSSP